MQELEGLGRVVNSNELLVFFTDLRSRLKLKKSIKFPVFLEFLLGNGLRKIEIAAIHYKKTFKRYVWGNPSVFEIALSLHRGCYLSHSTSVFLHGLSEHIPRTVYVNYEQSPKPSRSPSCLTQESIDKAFKKTQRLSRYEFRHEGSSIILLSGKHTNKLEVSEIDGPQGEALLATKIERTLIDIAVRPAYAGGVYQVLEAYKGAREKISTNVLLATLKKLGYLYPYHQAIGFYLELSGYEPQKLQRLRSLGLHFDFYLAHGLKDHEYDPSWRIYFPKGMKG